MKKNNTKIFLRSSWTGRQLRSLRTHTKQSVLYSPRYGRTLLAMAVFLMVIKMVMIHEAYGAVLQGAHLAETLINYLSIIASDFMIIGLIFVGAFLNAVVRTRWFKRYVNVTALLLMLLYVSDMFSIYYFQSRFYMIDLLQFFSFKNSASYVLYPFVRSILFVTILFVIFLLVQKLFPVIRRKNMHLRSALVFFGMCVLFSGVNLFTTSDFHFRNNALAINVQEISALLRNEDADMLPGRSLPSYESYFVPMVGQKRTGDLIVIFAESFSVVDSKRDGGIHDYLSGFDTIQADGITYTNFIANGCTSETAHIALLQGVEPWESSYVGGDAYEYYKSYTNSLPSFFHTLGYKTTFLSTAPLSFLHQRDFLSGLKYDTIIGEEAFLAGPKYVFNASPDEELYKKALQLVRTKDPKRPLFLTMQTISSHKPYNSPDGTTEKLAFQYSDKAIKAFYDQLKKDGYFRHGTLVIVGDHRKMEPLEREEFQAYGQSANGRATMTIVGPGIKPGTYSDDVVQHIDVFSSLKYLYGSGQVVLNSRFNDILGKYAGRKQAIRYCQYVERQYIATDKENNSRTINATTDKQNLSYINSFKIFQHYTGSLTSDMKEVEYLKREKGVTIIGHAGGAPMIEAPESYSAMKRAREQGADSVEFDLSLTKDGYNVVMHGPDMGRSKCKNSDGKKNVSDYTLKQIKDNCLLLNGEPILTFIEALQKTEGWFKNYFVDIKVYDDAKIQQQMDEIMQTVKKLGLEKKAVLSTYSQTGNAYLANEGKEYTLAWDTFSSADYTKLKEAPHAYFMIPFSSYTPEIVNSIHSLKKEVVAYTVNDLQDVQKLYDMGIRVFMTDNVPMIIDRLRSSHSAAKTDK